MDENKITIQQCTKGSVAFMIAGAVLIVANLAFVITNVADMPLSMRIAMSAGAIFFCACLIYKARNTEQLRNILVVDEDGIVDFSTGIMLGFIPWVDVAEISVITNEKAELIQVKVNNGDKYLARMGWFQRRVVPKDKETGSPIAQISLAWTDVKAEDVLPEINKMFEQYKTR